MFAIRPPPILNAFAKCPSTRESTWSCSSIHAVPTRSRMTSSERLRVLAFGSPVGGIGERAKLQQARDCDLLVAACVRFLPLVVRLLAFLAALGCYLVDAV